MNVLIPRSLSETDIPEMTVMQAESLNAALLARKSRMIRTPADKDAKLREIEKQWKDDFRAVAARDDYREVLKGLFNYYSMTALLDGFAWFGPCREYPTYSEEWGEIYELYMQPHQWEDAEDLVDIAAADFRRHGFDHFIMHKPHGDPNAEGFYKRMRESANKVLKGEFDNDRGQVSTYLFEL